MMSTSVVQGSVLWKECSVPSSLTRWPP